MLPLLPCFAPDPTSAHGCHVCAPPPLVHLSLPWGTAPGALALSFICPATRARRRPP